MGRKPGILGSKRNRARDENGNKKSGEKRMKAGQHGAELGPHG